MDLTNKGISISSNSSYLGWISPQDHDHPVKFGIHVIWFTGFRSTGEDFHVERWSKLEDDGRQQLMPSDVISWHVSATLLVLHVFLSCALLECCCRFIDQNIKNNSSFKLFSKGRDRHYHKFSSESDRTSCDTPLFY